MRILLPLPLLVLWLASVAASIAFAADRPAFEAGVDQLLRAEQELISRDVDDRRITSPHQNSQAAEYTPEEGRIFAVKTYWIDASEFHSFFADGTPTAERALWERTKNRRRQIRFAVHPESESLYADFLAQAKGVERAEDFLATATASSRTLLVWPEGHPEQAFFGKLSLNRLIGGVVRTIPVSETSRSVGTTNVLHAEEAQLPKGFHYFPEMFGAIPKDMDRGGMLIREIPREVRTGEERVVPLFSLYASSKDGRAPLLAEMIRASGLPAEDFVRERIVRPFVTQWLHLELDFGITMEPHAQNVLIGIGPDGLPDGKFYHRDFGGFGLDLAYRDRLGRPHPALPYIRSVDQDYHQVSEDKSYDQALPRSLITFFSAGFLFNLDQKIPAWRRAGLIDSAEAPKARWWQRLWPRKTPNAFEPMVAEELSRALSNITQQSVELPQPLQAAELLDVLKQTRIAIHPVPKARATARGCALALASGGN